MGLGFFLRIFMSHNIFNSIEMIKRILLIVFVFVTGLLVAQNKVQTLNNDGAWCWFSDPRAIYVDGKDNTILTGWVKSDGSIETAILDTEKNKIKTQVIYPQLEIDDHDNPAFLQLSDKSIMAFYAKHCALDMYWNKADFDEDVVFGDITTYDPIIKSELDKYPHRQVTYANPYQLSKEDDRIYVLGRWTGFKPNIMWSDDHGESFTKSKVFIAEEGFRRNNRPYVKYYSDGKSRIHIIMTDGHPRKEATNSVYYAYFENKAFWRMDGTKICNLDEIPFQPTDATVVYKATEETGRAWVYDVVADKKGRPTILYARYPSEQEHLYYYATYDGRQWHNNKICHSGKWFPQTQEGKVEREPHYSGGLTIHPLEHNTVYVSKQVNGVFEIEKYVTPDKGMTWEVTAITQNSKYDNVRPVVPRNMSKKDKTMVLWMENEKYIHYTNYKSNIKYIVED